MVGSFYLFYFPSSTIWSGPERFTRLRGDHNRAVFAWRFFAPDSQYNRPVDIRHPFFTIGEQKNICHSHQDCPDSGNFDLAFRRRRHPYRGIGNHLRSVWVFAADRSLPEKNQVHYHLHLYPIFIRRHDFWRFARSAVYLLGSASFRLHCRRNCGQISIIGKLYFPWNFLTQINWNSLRKKHF